MEDDISFQGPAYFHLLFYFEGPAYLYEERQINHQIFFCGEFILSGPLLLIIGLMPTPPPPPKKMAENKIYGNWGYFIPYKWLLVTGFPEAPFIAETP